MLSLFGNARGRKKKPQLARLPILFKIHPIKQYNRKEFSNDNDPECFHRAIGSILFLSQFFGILPINHIRAVNIKKFSFKRFSPRTIYSYCILFTIFIMTLISVVHLLKTLNTDSFQTKGGISDATIGAVFYGNSLIGNIMFLRLCPRWISIQYDWRAMEQILDEKWKKPALRWRFTIISWTILSLALLEHLLSMVKNVPLADWGSHSFGDFIFVYTKKSHHFIIQNIDYNFLLGLFIFVVSKIATFTWNFTDLFIMIISTAIAERYKCLNERIIRITPERVTIADWYKFRQSYAILSTLVKKIDNEISGIVLLSFTNNIYFICLQLLNGLSPNNSENPIMNSIYFFGSFIFLIGRTTAVTLLTARINDQCKVILPVLYNCPSINYCLEAQRLQNQICNDDVALTGHRFFSITRNFMLAVAGAIVTYEVVLLQFNIALQRD
ncbi:PREDICTED: gustatory receptor for sugar taste 64f-like [Ceratosolen solmsi marchali]|uniref:Gustatory receptor n=1 Tax=Ceratosolen solmsi marchali TaxID=326594 RepID=A0AAJ6YRI1_9HYME|nr:PREDICTED: gustatory receptor for sugar taste 64f-like [Ceratosolen solmsi marchali]